MSFQRAYICCTECYRSYSKGYTLKFEARESAMQALEEAAKIMNPLMEFPNKKIEDLAKECLDTCFSCKGYPPDRPKITDLIDAAKKDPDKESK